MTYHANEEMAEDNLGVLDVETTLLNGRIVRTEKDDPLVSNILWQGLELII